MTVVKNITLAYRIFNDSRETHHYGLSVNIRMWSSACAVKCATELAGRAPRRRRRRARWASCRRTCASRSTRRWARPSPTPPSTSSAPPSPDSSKQTTLVWRVTSRPDSVRSRDGSVVTSVCSVLWRHDPNSVCFRDARVTCDVKTLIRFALLALRFCDVTLRLF